MFSVGDKVKVRSDLNSYTSYGVDSANDIMVNGFAGKDAVVTKFYYKSGERCYRLNIDGGDWCWTYAMLEPGSQLSPFGEWESKYVLTSVNQSVSI